MSKILLTGAAGFVGARTCRFLLERGVEVVAIDNMDTYYDVRLKYHRIETLKKYEGLQWSEVDIENLNELKLLFARHEFDAVINLAAKAGVAHSIENPHAYMSTNGQGTLNILEMMRKYKTGKLVLASTSSLYAGQAMPFVEDLPVNTPISPYAASKKAAEVMSYTYHYLFGIDVSVVRYFTVYGPAGRPDMSPFRFIKWIDEGAPIQLYGDGSQARDFTYIDDIAEGTIKALKKVGYEIINLGGGKNPVSLNDLIGRIEDRLGKKAIIAHKASHKTDMKETWADIGKAKRILGWEPEIDLDVGLKRTVDWYLQNKEWAKEIKI